MEGQATYQSRGRSKLNQSHIGLRATLGGLAAFVLAAVLLWGGTASAADSSCERARTATAVAICSDPELTALNERLVAVYRDARRESRDPSKLRRRQSAWIAEVSACGSNSACIRSLYLRRIEELGAVQTQAPASVPVPAPAQDRPSLPPTEPFGPRSDQGHQQSQSDDSIAPNLAAESDPSIDDGSYVSDAERQDAEPESTPNFVQPEQHPTEAAPTSVPTEQRSAGWPSADKGLIGGGMLLALILVILAAFLATKSLADRTKAKYNYNMILNWWNVIHLVAILTFVLLMSFGQPLAGAVVYAGLWLVMLVVNIMHTSLLTGLAMTIIQPFVIFILWAAYGFARKGRHQ